jgi:TPR repeat protein
VESGNLLKGIKYLKKAVELKYPRAFYNLGKCYENGVGVSQNID